MPAHSHRLRAAGSAGDEVQGDDRRFSERPSVILTVNTIRLARIEAGANEVERQETKLAGMIDTFECDVHRNVSRFSSGSSSAEGARWQHDNDHRPPPLASINRSVSRLTKMG